MLLLACTSFRVCLASRSACAPPCYSNPIFSGTVGKPPRLPVSFLGMGRAMGRRSVRWQQYQPGECYSRAPGGGARRAGGCGGREAEEEEEEEEEGEASRAVAARTAAVVKEEDEENEEDEDKEDEEDEEEDEEEGEKGRGTGAAGARGFAGSSGTAQDGQRCAAERARTWLNHFDKQRGCATIEQPWHANRSSCSGPARCLRG